MKLVHAIDFGKGLFSLDALICRTKTVDGISFEDFRLLFLSRLLGMFFEAVKFCRLYQVQLIRSVTRPRGSRFRLVLVV